jgi:hypothetical protein
MSFVLFYFDGEGRLMLYTGHEKQKDIPIQIGHTRHILPIRDIGELK